MKLLYRLSFIITFFALSTVVVQAQNGNAIQGTIVDVETNEPLPGVSISVKGTVLGTTSDSKGKFAIAPKSYPATLTFSLVGFRAQEVEVPEASSEELPIELTAGA